MTPYAILARATLLLIALLTCVPLARFLLLPFIPAFGPAHTPPPGFPASLAPALYGSVGVALPGALIATPAALWLGLLLERRVWRGNALLQPALWVLFILPGYLVASGWEVLMAQLDAGSEAVLRRALLGWPGFVLITALKGLPAASFACRAGWASLEPATVDAGVLHVHDKRARWMLGARTMLPFASAAFVIVFVESTQDFGLATTLGGRLATPLLVNEIYRSVTAWPVSWSRAARGADLLVLLAASVLLLRLSLGAGSRAAAIGRRAKHRPRPASAQERGAGIVATTVILLLGACVPLSGFVSDLLSAERSGEPWGLPEGSWQALSASMLYAGLGAFVALLMACSLLAGGARSSIWRLLALASMVNMAVPGVVLGAAWIITFGAPPVILTGTPLALLLASAISQLPLLLLLLGSTIVWHGDAPGDAARVHGLGLLDRIELIHLPCMVRPLAWGWSLAFSRIFFELPLATLLAPAGGEPVGVLLVQLQRSLQFSGAAALAFTAIVICGGVVTFVCTMAARLV